MKAIITVLGRDRVGIIASTCSYLAENNINILDITQSIIDGYFNMMMIVDISESKNPLAILVEELEELGKVMNVDIRIQHEDIFDSMHRI